MNMATTSREATRSGLGINQRLLQDLSAEAFMEWADSRFGDGLVMTTSFGIQAAVTLDLATRVRPNLPVVWVDTGYLPAETYRYADELTAQLGLNLHVYRADLAPSAMEDRFGRLWETGLVEDLDLYDWVRKVEPLRRAFEDLNPTAWITGLRASQTDFRRTLQRTAWDGTRHKLFPILHWSQKEVYEHMQRRGLPQHPLWEQGYTTVGDWHSSRPIEAADADARSTRFGGLKQECGIHA